MLRRIAWAAAPLIVLVLLVPGSALAADRHAEVGGDGPADTCPLANPCSITDAVNNTAVQSGDQILIAPGDYSTGSTNLMPDANPVTIRGTGDKPSDTRITTSSGFGVYIDSMDSVISNLQVTSTGVSAVYANQGTIDRVIAININTTACEVKLQGTIRSSLCVGGNTSSATPLKYTPSVPGTFKLTVRNVTTWGGYVPFYAAVISADVDATIDAKSVIAGPAGPAGPPGPVDLNTQAGSTLNVTFDHSNYASATTTGAGTTTVTAAGSGTNQTEAPKFVDVAANNFHQLSDSVTRNAGAVDIDSSAFDYDNEKRTMGTAPDIGADEFTEADPVIVDPGTGNPIFQPPAADITPPVTAFKKRPKKSGTATKAKFVFSITEPGLTFKCKLDKKKYKSCKSNYSVTVKPGKHKLSVIATDPAGNADTSAATYSWTVKKKK
jgi:hypothetical protein